MENEEQVIRFLQVLLQAELGKRDITPTVIAEKLDWLLKAGPQLGFEPDGFDRQTVTDEMIRRFSLWIGKDTMLTSDTGHEGMAGVIAQEGLAILASLPPMA